MLLNVRRETQCPFPGATGILGFLSMFKRSQASSPFEALNSTCLSRCQRDVRRPVVMRWGARAFSWDSTRDTDIHSSCEMKDEPAFKPQQKSSLLSSQGITVSIPIEAANTGSLSQTYW